MSIYLNKKKIVNKLLRKSYYFKFNCWNLKEKISFFVRLYGFCIKVFNFLPLQNSSNMKISSNFRRKLIMIQTRIGRCT